MEGVCPRRGRGEQAGMVGVLVRNVQDLSSVSEGGSGVGVDAHRDLGDHEDGHGGHDGADGRTDATAISACGDDIVAAAFWNVVMGELVIEQAQRFHPPRQNVEAARRVAAVSVVK